MALRAKSLYTHPGCDGFNRASVIDRTISLIIRSNRSCRSGLVIKCQPDEFAIFDPPAGQNCSTWAQSFVDIFNGYLDNAMDTAACRYCQYQFGDQFFVPLNISFSHRWRDAFILFAFFSESLPIRIFILFLVDAILKVFNLLITTGIVSPVHDQGYI
jgi:hypothetical protein